MAFTVRGLLAKVAMYRPDKDEAISLFAIQEAVRTICRYAPLPKEVQPPVALLAGATTTTVAPSNSNDLLRVEEIRYAAVPQPSSYKGTWDANANIPVLSNGGKTASVVVPAYGFYIVSTAGTTTIDSLTGWNVGDVAYSNGTSWVKIARQDFLTSTEFNKPSVDRYITQAQSGTGTPDSFAQEGNTVFWYPAIVGDTAIEVTVSYIPVGEFDTIPLPREAEDVVCAGAIEFIASLPGEGFNASLAMMKHKQFEQGKENLRALAELGYGGDAWVQPPNFAGRRTTVSPYNATTWVL